MFTKIKESGVYPHFGDLLSIMAFPLIQVGICSTISSSAPFSVSSRELCILLSKEVFLNSEPFFLVNLQVLDVGCGIGGPLREIARFR